MKILCIHSLAIHGTASLKVVIRVLGNQVLPVASLYLSGLTNLPNVIKTEVDFEPLLHQSFELAKGLEERLWVYVGYLGSAEQTRLITKLLHQYRDLIEGIIVDPVSGDHGRVYVPAEVVQAWPSLLELADWALPNYTEVRLFSGLPFERDDLAPEVYLDRFAERFPHLQFLATSLPDKEKIRLCLQQGPSRQFFSHPRLKANYGGTGDYFAAQFIDALVYQGLSPQQAMEVAANKTLECLRQTIAANSRDLLI